MKKTKDKNKKTKQHARMNEELSESLTDFDSMQKIFLKKVIAWVNLITDFQQHVVVVFDICPVIQSVCQSRAILWQR